MVQKYVLLGGGLYGIYYETVKEHADRPGLLIVFMCMVGLSSVAASVMGSVSGITQFMAPKPQPPTAPAPRKD